MYRKLNKIYHNKKWISLNNNYGISENGIVFSFIKNKIMKTYKDPKGYDIIYLKDSNNKKITCKISRLVGFAYLEDFDENYKYEINHIDGNKENNHFTNLEWCDRKYNVHHEIENDLLSKEKLLKNIKILQEKNKKKVAMLDKENNLIKIFNSIVEASKETGYNKNTIRDSCSGLRKSNHTKYNWKYI